MTSNTQAGSGPLKGLSILDLTTVVMGPYATQMLGEMGADVIKVEAPDGDVVRQIGPARNDGMGALFLNANRSKRSIALDLKSAEGREVLLRLAAAADVFIYNVRPQAMERLRLGYDDLRKANPRIIYAGVFGYAQNGCYAAKPAYDDLIQGASSLASVMARSNGGTPSYVPLALADRLTGMAAVGAILAAVYERSRSGEGQRVDVPMFENLVSFVLSDHMGGKTFVPPIGETGYARLLSPRRRPYQTKDGYVCALVYTDKHWRSFYSIIGKEDRFESDPRMRSIATRSEHIDDIYAELETEMAARSTAEWLATFARCDIPAAPLHDTDTVFDDPHLTESGFFGTELHPTEGLLQTMQHPNQWSRTQPSATCTAPRKGQDAEDILREAGYAQEQINRLLETAAARSRTTSAA